MPYKNPEEQRRYQRELVARRRAEWLEANGPCAQCGSDVQLQVDHIDPSTKVHHSVWSWSAERRAAELAKCQVLCRPCHEAKTAAENSARMGGYKHGTMSMYHKMKCRCGPCRGARQKYRAERKAKGLRW